MDITEILKNCEKGTHLYSSIHGKVQLASVNVAEAHPIKYKFKYTDGTESYTTITKEGKFYNDYDGECTLFPSAKMRDWTKFYKRGDLIYDNETNSFAIFNKWVDDNYTAFHVKYKYNQSIWGLDGVAYTAGTLLVKPNSESYNRYMKRFEKHFNGKLNIQTLQIESLFKPYDKVLVRNSNDDRWEPDIFALHEEGDMYEYICLRDSWMQCIPYDEARVGTTE